MTASVSFDQWIQHDWQGNEPAAIAACLADLADAWGGAQGEWGTLTEEEMSEVLGHFSSLQPTRVSLPAVAAEYAEHIGDGNLRAFAAALTAEPGAVVDAEELAPVWSRQLKENRASTQQFMYQFELSTEDYDAIGWGLGSLLEAIQANQPEGNNVDEYVLNLKMIMHELSVARERSIPATTGNKREFFVRLTPEYLEFLLAHSDQWANDDTAPADFRAYWQRIDYVLRSAPSRQP